MWNLKPSSEFINEQYIARQQLLHLQNIQSTSKMIENSQPYQSSYSLSRNENKYTKSKNKKIWYENQNLLDKIIAIEKKEVQVNEEHKIHSLQEYLRKTNKKIMETQNQKLLKRLENSQSVYGKSKLDKQYKQHQQYRKNLQAKKRSINVDYTQKAKQLQFKLWKQNIGNNSQTSFRNPNINPLSRSAMNFSNNKDNKTSSKIYITQQFQPQYSNSMQSPQAQELYSQKYKQFMKSKQFKGVDSSSYYAGSPSTNVSQSQKKRPQTGQNYSPGQSKLRKQYFQFPDL